MKLALLVNHDAPAGLALHYLLRDLAAHDVRVFYTDRGVSGEGPLARLAIEGGEPRRELSSFETLAAERMNDINGRDFDRWAAWAPELALSIRHMSILRPPAISVPRFGVINLHSGLLPAYQGVMATFWAMSHGETELGTTVHWVQDAAIDRGDVLAMTTVRTRYDRSYFWNVLNLYRDGVAALARVLQAIADGGRPRAVPQQSGGSYFSFPKEQDLAAFNWPLFSPDDSPLEFVIAAD